MMKEGHKPCQTYEKPSAFLEATDDIGTDEEILMIYGDTYVDPVHESRSQTMIKSILDSLKSKKSYTKQKVYVAESKIAGLGLFARNKIDQGDRITGFHFTNKERILLSRTDFSEHEQKFNVNLNPKMDANLRRIFYFNYYYYLNEDDFNDRESVLSDERIKKKMKERKLESRVYENKMKSETLKKRLQWWENCFEVAFKHSQKREPAKLAETWTVRLRGAIKNGKKLERT
ncbi:hypothetical protein M951_chr3167 (nucleomorph) [Lotharella oceanica]|uniref:Uncharacterized protein n=1 Tax=Lotharella oceanica TaxID=641309 RepID=A0A060DAF0_9EUKA|nr:hypothetical protein M951_chr138 [Lotharella oceanica]AIB09672.1 hypothetical protein M951_chr1193 [Lotharella oceanica]AIB09741.1 hypothetical protein M951_chr238 [Lotharella oceanica]AIB09875.1 hypothetical protein M951_chr2183 [Lotharella oceanica]AIB09944.1 hypothetical protein M951_chr338 [Lotharella oceanica]